MPATTDRPKADRTKLPLVSRGPLLQESERHYRKGSRTSWKPKEEGEAGGRNVPAGCSSTMPADLTSGKREREGWPRTKKYKHGGPRRGHDFSKNQPDRPCTSGESAIPESRATRATTSPITGSCDHVLTMEGGLPTVQIAKQDASRSTG